jgi:hypothetical protein
MGNDIEIKPQEADYEPDAVEEVPLYKKALCGNHWFGDFFYMFWKNMTCHCCIFFRGVAVGLAIALALKLVF